jgi:hypothetical protein
MKLYRNLSATAPVVTFGVLVAATAIISPPDLAAESGSVMACGVDGMPSCAPHRNWDCIHPGVNLPHRCDPNDQGCIVDDE